MSDKQPVHPVNEVLLGILNPEPRRPIVLEAAEQICCHGMPWRTPWLNDLNSGIPTNARTGRVYCHLSALLMDVKAAKHGFYSKYWGTAQDWNSLGLAVQGVGHEIPYETDTLQIRYSQMWNGDEVIGGTASDYQCQSTVAVDEEHADWNNMQELLDACNPCLVHTEKRTISIYEPPKPWRDFPNHSEGDYIEAPFPESCTPARYWTNNAHELIHWAEVRIGWCPRPFEDDPQRELVAEMGCAYIMRARNCPMDDDMFNYRDYNRRWAERMTNNNVRWLIDAAQYATDAAFHDLSYLPCRTTA